MTRVRPKHTTQFPSADKDRPRCHWDQNVVQIDLWRREVTEGVQIAQTYGMVKTK